MEHIRTRYCRTSVTFEQGPRDTRARDNVDKIEELMRFRKQGMTLGQKITSHLEKIKSKNVISLMSDSFFAPQEEQGS